EVRIHYVEWHLHRGGRKAVRERYFEHMQVDIGTLVAGESDVANLAGALRVERALEAAARSENLFGITDPYDFVELHQVDAIGLQPLQALIDLLRRAGPAVAVDFGHQEDLVAIAIAQCRPHPALALAGVIVPAVVHEVDAAIDGGTNDADRFLRILRHRHVVAAQTHDGN